MKSTDKRVIDITETDNPRDWVIEKELRNNIGYLKCRWTEVYNEKYIAIRDGLFQAWNKYGNLIKEVNYENGKLDGKYREWYKSTIPKVDGSFKESLRHGHWVYYGKGGLVESFGEFEKGSGTLYYPDSSLRLIEYYDNGKRIGIWKIWYPNGLLKQMYDYTKNSGEFYNPDGSKSNVKYPKSEFVNHNTIDRVRSDKYTMNLDSLKITYHPNGKLKHKAYFDGDEKLIKIIKWSKERIKVFEANYRSGLLHGNLKKHWFNNGELMKDNYYKNGKLTGTNSHYKLNGDLLFKKTYINDSVCIFEQFYDTIDQVQITGKLVNDLKDSLWTYRRTNNKIFINEAWEMGNFVRIE